MSTPKPAWGKDVHANLALYNPSAETLNPLIAEIERITETTATKAFRRVIWQLITLLRQNADSYHNAPDIDNTLKELEYVQKAMQENIRIFDMEKGINAKTQRFYTEEFIVRNFMDEKDLVLNLNVISHVLLEITESVKKRALAAKKNSKANQFNSLTHMRQIAAEELARALDDELGFKPGKTRDGKFEKCFRALLLATECELNGRDIFLNIPTDMFKIIKAAIDKYPQKERYSLLLQEGEIFPGLSGSFPT